VGDLWVWARGATVDVRHVWRERVWFAHPAIVVEDSPQRLVLFEPAGTIRQWSHFDFETGEIEPPRPMARHTTDALIVMEPGAAHAVSLFWRAGSGDFLCWYVDLQCPFVREPNGIITWDQHLDIVVAPRRSWVLKDEDHLEAALGLGWLSPDESAAVRREANTVIARIEAGEPPFDETWRHWRPDPAWAIPSLAEGWDRIP
jgi:hypothetical protein